MSDSVRGVARPGTPYVHKRTYTTPGTSRSAGICLADTIRMQIPVLAVVCAWCKRTISTGPAGSAVTHTICPECVEWAMAHPLEIPQAPYGGYDDRRDVPDCL